MAAYVAEGCKLPYVSSGGDSAGDVKVVSGCVGVVVCDVADGETGSVQITGVIDSVSDGTTIADGDAVYWDATNGYFTETTTSNTLAGRCVGGTTSPATAIRVLLLPR